MEKTKYGLAPTEEGWFVVNVRDGAWMTNEHFGEAFVIEGDAVQFPQIGYTVHVLGPGQANGLYHREEDQEDFFVLAGECIAILEGEERLMHAWDFLHCPAGTEHILVGAGDGPCVIFMAGAREHRGTVVYTPSAAAEQYGASVEADKRWADEPYAPFPKWQPGPPTSFEGLPFG